MLTRYVITRFSRLEIEKVLSEGRGERQLADFEGGPLAYGVVDDDSRHLLEGPWLGAQLSQATVKCRGIGVHPRLRKQNAQASVQGPVGHGQVVQAYDPGKMLFAAIRTKAILLLPICATSLFELVGGWNRTSNFGLSFFTF